MICDPNQIEKRRTLVDLMLELHGRDYTLGWLRSAYIQGFADQASEDVIVDQTLEELLTLAASRNAFQDNAVSNHAIGYYDE